MSYSYDRRTASGSWFDFFYALPRQAMTGNSFTPVQVEVRPEANHLRMKLVVKGTTQGSSQHVVDSIRFAVNDVREATDHFFSLGLSRYPHRVHTKVGVQVSITNSGLTVYNEVTFSFKDLNLNQREALESAALTLGLDITVAPEVG